MKLTEEFVMQSRKWRVVMAMSALALCSCDSYDGESTPIEQPDIYRCEVGGAVGNRGRVLAHYVREKTDLHTSYLWLPGGKDLVFKSIQDSIKLVNVTSGELRSLLELSDSLALGHGLETDQHGEWVYYTAAVRNPSGRIYLYRLSMSDGEAQLLRLGDSSQLIMSDGGGYLALWGAAGLDHFDGQVWQTVDVPWTARGTLLSLSPDGGEVFTSRGFDIFAISLTNGVPRLVWQLETIDGRQVFPVGIRYESGKAHLLATTCCGPQHVYVYEDGTGERRRTVEEKVEMPAFSLDGAHMAAWRNCCGLCFSGYTADLMLFDLHSGSKKVIAGGHFLSGPSRPTFSPEGGALVYDVEDKLYLVEF